MGTTNLKFYFSAPKGTQDAPGSPQETPRGPHKAPKRPKRGPNMPQNSFPKVSKLPPPGPREDSHDGASPSPALSSSSCFPAPFHPPFPPLPPSSPLGYPSHLPPTTSPSTFPAFCSCPRILSPRPALHPVPGGQIPRNFRCFSQCSSLGSAGRFGGSLRGCRPAFKHFAHTTGLFRLK